MKGKEKCMLLKSIRCRIARENGIDYRPAECHFQGECKGTCPRCEAELQKLTLELQKLKETGKRVAVAGIAAAMVAGSAAGCVPRPLDEGAGTSQVDQVDFDGIVAAPEEANEPETQTDGELPPKESEIEGEIVEAPKPDPEGSELTGDIAFPEETESEEKTDEALKPDPEESELTGDIAFPEETPDA